MCGIVGYIAKTKKLLRDERQHFLRYALIMDTLRGHDSTGVMTVHPGFKVTAYKAATPGYKFIAHPEYEKIKKDGWCTVGHNRAATAGSVTRDNAHPFLFGDVALVHNGTLARRGSSLDSFDPALAVDSMQIANALSIAAPKEADEILEQIDGSFTLAWFDNRDQSINLARNRERPMHFCVNKERTFMMFMSDGDMLTALNRSFPGNNEARGECVYSLDSYKHLKFHYGDLVPEVTRFRPFSRPVVVYTPPPRQPRAHSTGTNTTDPSRTGTSGDIRTSSIDLPPHKTKSAEGRSLLIPKAHTEALNDKYEMTPDMRLRFTPKVAMQVSDYLMRVYGEIYYPKWYSEWPAVINWVPLVQWNAYYKSDWLVRPIGLSNPNEHLKLIDMPAVMCELLKPNFHFHPHSPDWFLLEEEGGKNERVQRTLDMLIEEEEEDDPDEQLVAGPQGIPVKRKKLRKLLEDGCMRCTGPLMEDDAVDMAYVNNGQQVICESCKWALEGEE